MAAYANAILVLPNIAFRRLHESGCIVEYYKATWLIYIIAHIIQIVYAVVVRHVGNRLLRSLMRLLMPLER